MKKPNYLIDETSPYLLQHAHNPVAWYPWGETAFEKAKAEDKPVFLSIGYSTCHWCHVMESESFEDEDVAAYLNANFVSIKVDREERPDIDSVYMSVCQALTGNGGWPLTVIMTSEGKPFFAGTYLPKTSKYGRIGLLELLKNVREVWQNNRATINENAQAITSAIQKSSNQKTSQRNDGAESISGDIVQKTYSYLSSAFDGAFGGFGSEPKFPAAHNLLFLLEYFRAQKNGGESANSGATSGKINNGTHCGKIASDKANIATHNSKISDTINNKTHCDGANDKTNNGAQTDEITTTTASGNANNDAQTGKDGGNALIIAEKTLIAMYKGGIFDHIGYGFSRYSTDRLWLVPHFEKMLYDNALLLSAYVKAYDITHAGIYKTIADKIIDYVFREMSDASGAFYSAQDADVEGEEGKFYTFSPSEIIGVLGEKKGRAFINKYGITNEGNFEGKSIPNLLNLGDNTATNGNSKLPRNKGLELLGNDDGTFATDFESAANDGFNSRLYEYRKNRFDLNTDDKVLTSWNCLMIAALAEAAASFENKRYLEAAQKAHNAINTHLRRGDEIFSGYRQGKHSEQGFLDDYAFYVYACIRLYKADFNTSYIDSAIRITERIVAKFSKAGGGFFLSENPSDVSNLNGSNSDASNSDISNLDKSNSGISNLDGNKLDASNSDISNLDKSNSVGVKSGKAGLIFRPIETYDGAMPSGNSVMCYNLAFLAAYTGEKRYYELLDKQIGFMAAETSGYHGGASFFALACLTNENLSKVVCVLGKDCDERELNRLFQSTNNTREFDSNSGDDYSNTGIADSDSSTYSDSNAANIHELSKRLRKFDVVKILNAPSSEYPLKNNKTTFYICKGGACIPPQNELPQ